MVIKIVPVVAQLHSRAFNPWTPSKISETRDDNFRKKLKNHLDLTMNNVPCMLTQQIGNNEQVCAAHILPCKTPKHILEQLCLDITDLNLPRNGLFLAKNIELQFDLLNLSFVPQDILHPNTLRMVLWSDIGHLPIWDGHPQTISHYDGAVLTLGHHQPFRRALAYQAYMAHSNCRSSEPIPNICGSPLTDSMTLFLNLEENLVTCYREEVNEEESEEDESLEGEKG
jgi:hypothetical protein